MAENDTRRLAITTVTPEGFTDFDIPGIRTVEEAQRICVKLEFPRAVRITTTDLDGNVTVILGA